MKILLKGLIIFLCIFLLSTEISGQSLRSGYIITNVNDTLFGQILYRAGKNASKECTILANDGIYQTFEPGQIMGYRFDEGKFYISKRIPVNNDTLLLFAEYLIKGLANIYYVNYNNINHYYIETNEKGIVELTEPERIAHIGDHDYILPPKYKGKLAYALEDYDSIQAEVKDVELNHKSLIKLARDYHDAKCDSARCIIFEKKVKRIKFKFGFSGGYTLTKYNFGKKLVSNYGPGFNIGGFVKIKNIVISNERFTLQLDLNLQKDLSEIFTVPPDVYSQRVQYNGQTYSVNHKKSDTVGDYLIYIKNLKTKINVVSLKFPITINYSGLSQFFRYYLGFGLNSMIVISQNKNFEYPWFEEEYDKTVPGFLFGIKTRTGIAFPIHEKNVLSCELNYDYLLNYNINKFYRLNIHSFAFLIRYRF